MFTQSLKRWNTRIGLGLPSSSSHHEGVESLLLARLGVLFFVLVVLVLIQLSRESTLYASELAVGYGLLAVAFLFNLINAAFYDRFPDDWGVAAANIAFDIGLTSAWVYLSGGKDSFYALLYLVQILIVALIFRQKTAVFSAALASIGFGLVSFFASGFSQSWMVSWAIYSSLFIVLGVVGGFLSEELHRMTTKLHEKQAALEKLRAFHEHVIHKMPTGFLSVDASMHITFVNPTAAHILNSDKDSLTGSDLVEVQPDLLPFFSQVEGAPVEEEEDVMEMAVGREGFSTTSSDEPHRAFFVNPHEAEGRVRLQQTVDITNKGVKKTLRGDVASLDTETAGELLGEHSEGGRILLFQDVTKLVHLEEKLKQHEKLAAVGQLAAGIAHEIRNPLASMSGSIEMLKRSIPKKAIGEEETRLMDIAIREIDRLNRLISEFLEFVKPVRLDTSQVDLKELLFELVTAAKSREDLSQTVHIETEFEEGVIAQASGAKLRQVVWNLIINAYQSMKGGGTIRVGCGPKPPNKVKFWVEDEGVGISEEVMGRLYEPFFTTKDKGTGLGLATAYKIIEAHHGEIHVSSQINKGTRFEIELPRA